MSIKKLFVCVFMLSTYLMAEKPKPMKNIGASCYINAPLQCIMNIPLITQTVLQGSSSHPIARTMKNILQQKGSIITPDQTICSTIARYEGNQDDAAVTVETTLYGLREAYSRQLNTQFPFIQSKLTSLDTTCPAESTRTEPAILLNVPINGSSLQECLAAFSSPEFIEDVEMTCQPTGQNRRVNARKKLTLVRPPELLIIQLKRFNYGPTGITKQSSPVTFPPQGALLSPENLVYSEEAHYILTGVVAHTGTYTSGHYIAYIKKNGAWYFCNDSKITPLKSTPTFASKGFDSTKEGKNYTPYILFYQKGTPQPDGGEGSSAAAQQKVGLAQTEDIQAENQQRIAQLEKDLAAVEQEIKEHPEDLSQLSVKKKRIRDELKNLTKKKR